MSEPVDPPIEPAEPREALGRGARRRRGHHERRLRSEAARWFAHPGVLVFLAVLLLSAAGWGLLVRAARRLPVEEATLGGLSARLDQATWIADQMDHGENFQRPAVMSPDMPPPGRQRVTVYVTLRNPSEETLEYRGEEFFLLPEIGEEVPPFGALLGEAPLLPGQSLNTAIHFDLDTTRPHGKLLMSWRREGEAAYFAVPNPPEHYHLRPRGESLPPDARLLLPIGKAERGERLYSGLYGCSACHGEPRQPGTNNLGPHLGNIGAAAAGRVAGQPAPQYLYDSMLEPDAFIAPECQNGLPCESPSAMPDYSSLVTLQDAADLLAFLLEQRAEPPPAVAPPARTGAQTAAVGEPLPPDAALLPAGKAARGERLFAGLYGCSACHGDPKQPGSNLLGPHLGRIGAVAHQRVPGQPAAQYLYRSLLEPDAFIAPECPNAKPCATPSTMPDYSRLVPPQDAADLLAFLLEQRAGLPPAPGAPDVRGGTR